MNAPAVSLNAAERFHELRRRYLAVRSLITAAAVVAMLLIGWLVLSLVDYQWEWSTSWRKSAILLVAVGVLMWLLRQGFRIVRDTRQRQFAAHLESEFDEFGQRIRTVLVFVDPHLLENCPGTFVYWRQFNEMLVQVFDHLFFGRSNKTEIDFVPE